MRLAATIGLLIALTLGVSACGNSSRFGSASSGAATVAEVGLVSDETYPGGITDTSGRDGAVARVDAINAAGGVTLASGRHVKLQLVTCDSKFDPNATATCARTLISDHVVADIAAPTQFAQAIFPPFQRAGIPVIGWSPSDPVTGNSPITLCFNPGALGAFLALPQLLASNGAKKVSLIFPESPATPSISKVFAAGAAKGGISHASTVTFPIGTTDFSSQIAKAAGGGVDGIAAFAPAAEEGPLLAALKQQAPNAKIATVTVQLLQSTLTSLGSRANNIYVVGLAQPATAKVRGIQLFNAEMDKYAPKAARTDFAITAWASVWALQQIAHGLPELSASGVLGAIKHTRIDTGGVIPPLDTSRRLPASQSLSCDPNPAVVYDKIEDAKLVNLTGAFQNPFAPASKAKP